MTPTPGLAVYLNFEGQCRAAFDYYRAVFGGDFSEIQTFRDGPDDAGLPESAMDQIMHVSLPVGSGMLMGSDVPPGFGPPLAVGSNVAISYSPASRDDADRVFAALSDDGQVTMELQDMFWGGYFGACTDRFGINWQIHLEGGQGRP